MKKILAGILIIGVAASSVPALAQGARADKNEYCYDLWLNRNQIYKNAGYCFKTAKAIREFGNAGCRYDNMAMVPLSRKDRADIADLQRSERLHRCPR